MNIELAARDAAAELTVSLAVDQEDVRVTETPYGVEIDFPEGSFDGTPGGPALPIVSFELALPPGASVREVAVKSGKPVPLTRKRVQPAPLQPAAPGVRRCSQPARLRDDGLVEPWPRPPFVPPDARLYEEALKISERPAQITAIDSDGPQPIATIVVHPVVLTEDGRPVLLTGLEVTVGLGVEPSRQDTQTASAGFSSYAQAERWVRLTRSRVINPAAVVDISNIIGRYLGRADYLVITDNQQWDADAIRPSGPLAGDLVAEFERLAAWKRLKGLSARVVTITDIVDGRYGQFTGWCRRDLQEVLREFVKWAHAEWGTAWLLLGGDIDIVPVRSVVGFIEGFSPGSTDPPDRGGSFWSGSYLKVRAAGVAVDTPLLRASDGHRIAYDPSGTSSTTQRGWYFTDASYTMPSSMPTEFIRVNGPTADVNTELFWLRDENTIPTDLYYGDVAGYPRRPADGYLIEDFGRLDSRSYGALRVCSGHDWDQIGNSLYGQWNGSEDLDGVRYRADVSVGRAPVGSAAEAKTFVDKVIAYERQSGGFLSTAWMRKLVFVSSNWWGGRSAYWPAATLTDDSYSKSAADDHAVIQLSVAPSSTNLKLLSAVTEADERELPFRLDASPTRRGWRYAVSGTDPAPSAISIQLPSWSTPIKLPIPSRWIVVYATTDEMSPAFFILDEATADESMLDQETLRAQLAGDVPDWSDVSRLYEDDVDLDPGARAAAPLQHLTAPRLESLLDTGPHIVSLSGHGSWGGCCGLNPSMRTSLTNGRRTFIGYADSCLTNQFDVSDAISEALVQNEQGGAVAYIGNTRYSWISVGDDFQRNFFKALPATRALGLLNDRRIAMLSASTGHWPVYNRWSIFSLNLIGDPEMHVWTDMPWWLCLEVPAKVRIDHQLLVQVLHGEQPVRNAHVTIEQPGYRRQDRSDWNGIAEFALNGANRGDLRVTAHHPNAAIATTVIQVIGPRWLELEVSGVQLLSDVVRVTFRSEDRDKTATVREGASEIIALLGQAACKRARIRALLTDDDVIEAVELTSPSSDPKQEDRLAGDADMSPEKRPDPPVPAGDGGHGAATIDA